MSDLSRNQVLKIIKELESSIVRLECLTCDCLQGLLTQLELDCPEDVRDLIGRLKIANERMHGCLGCDPCPPGTLFSQYLKSKNNHSKNNIDIKGSIVMETEKKKKGFFATIWESMTKTGGCCGGGESCCGSSNEDDNKTAQEKSSRNEEKRK